MYFIINPACRWTGLEQITRTHIVNHCQDRTFKVTLKRFKFSHESEIPPPHFPHITFIFLVRLSTSVTSVPPLLSCRRSGSPVYSASFSLSRFSSSVCVCMCVIIQFFCFLCSLTRLVSPAPYASAFYVLAGSLPSLPLCLTFMFFCLSLLFFCVQKWYSAHNCCSFYIFSFSDNSL